MYQQTSVCFFCFPAFAHPCLPVKDSSPFLGVQGQQCPGLSKSGLHLPVLLSKSESGTSAQTLNPRKPVTEAQWRHQNAMYS